MSYNYSATQNNGKIISQTDNLTAEQVVYSYDSLNRLATAVTQDNPSVPQWGQSYTYDGFGNLTAQNVIKGTAPTMGALYDPATNRRSGECADANGNVGSGCGTTYDIENRITNIAGAQYSYAPGNKRNFRRVVEWDPNLGQYVDNDEITFWSITGQRLATYRMKLEIVTPGYPQQPFTALKLYQTATWWYFGGKLIKNAAGYIGQDRVGSSGKFYPYGQEKTATANGKEKFATYFRDAESGLDYADQRYHSPGQGRFLTADPYRASGGPGDPGSWNRYSYVGGDPVNFIDSKGLERDECLAGEIRDPGTGRCVPDPFDTCIFGPFGCFPAPSSGGIVDSSLRSYWSQSVAFDKARLIENKTFSEKCEKAISGIENAARTKRASIDAVKLKARTVDFLDYMSDTPVPQDVKNGFAKGAHLMSYSGSARYPDTVWYATGWETGAIVGPGGQPQSGSESWRAADVFHELLHLAGFDDNELQVSLGLEIGTNTNNITIEIENLCFKP